MTGSKKVKPILEMIEEKKQQIQKLQTEIDTLEAAVRRVNGQPELAAHARRRNSNVKGYLVDLLERVGDSGLNASIAVEMAAKAGERLERGTASSLLSRFKTDGLVTYDGTVYRLVRKPVTAAKEESVVH